MPYKTENHIIKLAAIGLLATLVIPFSARAAEEPIQPEHKAHNQRPYEPLGKTAFLRLPLRSVRPEGWMRDWVQDMANGLFGYPDTFVPPEGAQVFGKGWTGVDLPGSKGARPKGTNWPLEQSATWIDGALRLGVILDDKPLTEKILKRLLFIADNMEKTDDDFYTFMWWWTTDQEPPKDFDLKSNGWLGRAMAAAYEATGDPRILKAVERAYRRHPYAHVAWGGGIGVNSEAMLEVFAQSGSPVLWEDLAKQILKTDPTYVGRLDALKKKTGNLRGWSERNHAASNTIYNHCELVATPWLENRAELLEMFERIFRTDEQYYMLPNGGLQGDEDMRGIGAYKGNESCSNARQLIAASLLWNTGKGYYGDRMEKGFFNFFPNCLQRDGKGYTYFSRVNNDPGNIGHGFMPLHGTLCCVGQMAKSMAAFVQNMWMGTWDNGLAWTAYGPSSVRAKVGDGEGVTVNLKSATAYPFEETIELSVDPEKPVTFPLMLRAPEWCANFSVQVNGTAVEAKADDKGFVTVRREWKAGDKVTLGLPMAPSVQVSRELEGAPFAAVHYGPLTMSLPLEIDDLKIDPNAEWKFAIDAPEGAEKNWKVERSPMPDKWNWPLAAPLSLTVTAIKADWAPIVRKAQDVAEELKRRDNVVTHTQNDVTCLPADPLPDAETVNIRLIPFGCTRQRITMFPITARTAPQIVAATPDPSLVSPLFVKESEIAKEAKENK